MRRWSRVKAAASRTSVPSGLASCVPEEGEPGAGLVCQRWDLLEITASLGFRILIRASSIHLSVRPRRPGAPVRTPAPRPLF